MPFLAYFAVLLIAVASAAFGLDLLTAPLPDSKPKVQAERSAPKAVRQIPIGRSTANADMMGDPDRALSPIYPANPAATHGASVAATQAASPQAQQAQARAEPAPQPQAVSQQQQPQPVAQQQAEAAPQPAFNAPVAQTAATQNRCDVRACANAYRSFRESDCSYQPLVGERRLCAISSGQQERIAVQTQSPRIDFNANARKRKEAELRDVERRVRALTGRAMDDDDDGGRASGVVVIDMRDGGDAPPSYSRQWQSWR